MQTHTPYNLLLKPQKVDLVREFLGKNLDELRTPAMVIDRAVFASNCARMHEKARQWGAGFRAHLKTHKTAEGTRLQLKSSTGTTGAVVVSTLMEAWEVVNAGLVSDGTVNDILYGLPLAINKIADISRLSETVLAHNCSVRVLIDNAAQIKALEDFENTYPNGRSWSVFIKCDGGQRRAGLVPGSATFAELLRTAFSSPCVDIYGFYAHAGDAYGSTSLAQANEFLSSEVQTVNKAAQLAAAFIPDNGSHLPFVLSVGSTPTAHSASAEARERLQGLLHGILELHAGNYPMLDLQQLHTSLIDRRCIAQKVLSTVISYYPGRGKDGLDEAMCDAGAIAMSKDTGPSGGYGEVLGSAWQLGRISQEHGILTRTAGDGDISLHIGSVIEIVGQHACLTAAAYPWFYIVDSAEAATGTSVVDVWVPWKGW